MANAGGAGVSLDSWSGDVEGDWQGLGWDGELD